MSFDVGRIDLNLFIFPFYFYCNFFDDLVNQIVNMSASFLRTNSIYKGKLFELTITISNDYFPTIIVDFTIENFLPKRIFIAVHFDII